MKAVMWSVVVGKRTAVMSHRHGMVLVGLAGVLTLAAAAVHADVFNMPTGQTSLSSSPSAIRATRRRYQLTPATAQFRLHLPDGRVRCDGRPVLPVP